MRLLNLFKNKITKLQKAAIADSVSNLPTDKNDTRRGYTVFSLSELLDVTGKTKQGKIITGKYQQPLFALSVMERNDIFRLCAPVLGVVSGRMNRIAGLSWNIIPVKAMQDKIVDRFKDAKNIYDEYDDPENIKMQIVRNRIFINLRREMPELLPGLKNFDASLLRWKKRVDQEKENRSQEIRDWMEEPNINNTWQEFSKMWVKDLMVHGGAAIYKEAGDVTLENFYVLPGGTVMPLRSEHPGGMKAFVQLLPTFRDTQIFFSDEICYSTWLPDSARSYGTVPMEALINKVAEYLFVDKKLANEADGTKPPEKILVFGNTSPFGSLDQDMTTPLNPDEQKKIETIINEERKNAIRVLTGYGKPMVFDLSRENMMPLLTDRQKSILKESIALVFNTTPNELGFTGSEDVSGRATSESQERVEHGKGIMPIVAELENKINKEILPFRYGTQYKLEYSAGLSETAQLEMYRKELEIGTPYNEIREMRNLPRHPDKEFDKPFAKGGAPQMPMPEGGELAGII